MLEFVIGFLGLSNLLCSKRKKIFFLAMVHKHLVQIACLRYVAGVVLIVTMPEFE
jgi:hypothetical protein